MKDTTLGSQPSYPTAYHAQARRNTQPCPEAGKAVRRGISCLPGRCFRNGAVGLGPMAHRIVDYARKRNCFLRAVSVQTGRTDLRGRV